MEASGSAMIQRVVPAASACENFSVKYYGGGVEGFIGHEHVGTEIVTQAVGSASNELASLLHAVALAYDQAYSVDVFAKKLAAIVNEFATNYTLRDCRTLTPGIGKTAVMLAGMGQAIVGSRAGETISEPLTAVDDKFLIPPLVQNQWIPPLASKSVGDIVEPVIRYIRELDAVINQLTVRRGVDSQEHFMFDVVAPFVYAHKALAIRDIDKVLITLPPSAKYGFPFLLGHLQSSDSHLLRVRRLYLEKYKTSEDEDIREGAEEALDHLNAA